MLVVTAAVAATAAIGAPTAGAATCDPTAYEPYDTGTALKGVAETIRTPSDIEVCLQNDDGLGWSGKFSCHIISSPAAATLYYSYPQSFSCGYNTFWRTAARIGFGGGVWGPWEYTPSSDYFFC